MEFRPPVRKQTAADLGEVLDMLDEVVGATYDITERFREMGEMAWAGQANTAWAALHTLRNEVRSHSQGRGRPSRFDTDLPPYMS